MGSKVTITVSQATDEEQAILGPGVAIDFDFDPPLPEHLDGCDAVQRAGVEIAELLQVAGAYLLDVTYMDQA